jgi:protein-disulfide isomerase
MRFSATVTTSLFTALFALSAHAQGAPATINRTEVETIVKDYLLKNPEVVVDALNGYQEKKMKEAQTKAQDAIVTRKKEIFEDASIPSVGAKDADVVIAEFFDYHCGYCKHMVPVITQLLAEDKKIRVVFHELPILSEDSALAARAAITVFKLNPDKYFAYHTALMKESGKFELAKLTALAKKMGVNEAKFKATIESPEVAEEIKKSQELSQALAINGTPAIVIGNKLISGAVGVDELKESIKALRTGAPAPAAPAK